MDNRDSAAAQNRLATYGTLAPGRPNAHQLEGLAGSWTTGIVRGRLVDHGWGAAMGYPALVPDPGGAGVEVHILHSADLPAHWARLDAFEGPEYERVFVDVEIAEGIVPASLYIHRRA